MDPVKMVTLGQAEEDRSTWTCNFEVEITGAHAMINKSGMVISQNPLGSNSFTWQFREKNSR